MGRMVENTMLMAFVLTGLISQNLGKSEFALVKQPSNATIEAGQSTVLNCEFNKPVKCSWQRNGSIVAILQRYKYVDPKEEKEPKTTCSIKISNAHKNPDYGPWICTFIVYSDGDPIQSNPAYLNVTEKAEDETTLEIPGYASTSTKVTTSTYPPNNNLDETSGSSDKILWISLAGGLVALSLLNTAIIVCYRRRARSRRSSRKTSPSTSCPTSPIIVNHKSNSMRRSTSGQPYNYETRLAPHDDDDYVTPMAMAVLMGNAKNDQKYENMNKKGDGHHYQNLNEVPEIPIYEEIMDQ